MTVTTILWDIDGVLNPFLATDLKQRGFIHVQEGWATWDISLLEHAPWMRDLQTKANFIWCTSWEEEANTISSYFGLTSYFDHIHLRHDETPPGNHIWKMGSVQKWLKDKPGPIIWLDDQFEEDDFKWAAARTDDTLLIQCDPVVGWTEEQYQQILDFITNH